MLVGGLMVFTMLLYGYTACKIKEDSDLIKRLILSQILFWCIYTLVSGILIWMDQFSVRSSVVGTAVIAILSNVFLFQKGRREAERKKTRFIAEAKYIPVLIICIAGAFLLQEKFGLYGLSQDEGVYQTAAISYIASNNAAQKDLVEYGMLDEISQEKFLDKMEMLRKTAMHGFYRFDESLKPRDDQVKASKVSGYYHGVGTYPAQLALWGWIFGIDRMMDVQTVFWILAVLLFYLAVDRFQISRWAKVLFTGIYAASPIMLWTGRASLTEMFLACLMNFFFYELCREEESSSLLIALPVVTFSFSHLTLFTIMPIICICLLAKFLYTGEKPWLLAGVWSALGYTAGILYISWSHTEYFYMNVQILKQIPFVTRENTILFMALCGIAGSVFFFLLWLLADRLPSLKERKGGKWILRILTVALTAVGIWQAAEKMSVEGYKGNLTLLSNCLLTGVVLLPLCILLLLRFSDNVLKNSNCMVVVLLFLYCVLFYSAVLRVDTLDHYYGDRYLLPFLALILLLIPALAEFGWNRIKYKIICGICSVAAIAYIIPHDIFILNHQDDTRLQWSTLQAIADKLEPGDILILQDDIMTSCFFPLRDMAGVHCFPVFEAGAYDTYESLKGLGGDIYLLSNGWGDRELGEYGWRWRVLCYECVPAKDEDIWDPLAMEVLEIYQRWSLRKMNEE